MERKIEIERPENSKCRVVYKVNPNNYVEDDKKTIIEQFSRKYGVDKSMVEVDVKYVDSASNGTACVDPDKISSILQPEFQLELIRKYLEESGVEGIDFDEIRKIDGLVNSRVDFGKYEKKSTYRINYIRFSNFLSYGDDNYLSFKDFTGLVLLRGNPANQSGKTTLCNDLVHFALFGKTKTGKADSLAQIFNRFRPDVNEVKVEASISVMGEEYIIIRTLTRPAKRNRSKKVAVTNSVEYYRKHEGDVMEEIQDCENMQAESTTATNKLLKEAIGNEKDFDLMSSINAPNLNEIIYLKDAERSRSMIRWFGLQSIEDKSVIARDIWNKEKSKGRYCDMYNAETLKNAITEIEQTNEGLEKSIKDNEYGINESRKVEADLNGRLEELIASLRPIDPELKKIDYNTLLKGLEDLKKEGKDMADKLEGLEKELNDTPEMQFSTDEYNECISSMNGLTGKISGGNYEIEDLRRRNDMLAKGEYCPTCGRKLENVDNGPAMEENNRRIASLTQSMAVWIKERDAADARRKELDGIRTYTENRNRLQLRIAQASAELEMKRNTWKDKIRTKKDIDANRESIEYNNGVQNSINICKANISAETNRQNFLNTQNLSHSSILAQNRETIRQYSSIIVSIGREIEEERNWKLYNQAIGKDGIPKMILRESIPLLNSQIRNLLRNSGIDFDVEIEMNQNNDILFLLKKGDVSAPLSSGSGYEQLVSSLVLRTVISQFSMISKPPFIILDEILGSVSSENLPKVRKLFENISSLYDFVFHITHLEDVVDWHNKVITVRKVDNVSYINEE